MGGDHRSAAFKLKVELMLELGAHARRAGWTAAEAARRFNVTLPRADELLRGQRDRFKLRDLVDMACCAGLRIEMNVTRPPNS